MCEFPVGQNSDVDGYHRLICWDPRGPVADGELPALTAHSPADKSADDRSQRTRSTPTGRAQTGNTGMAV